MADKRKQSFYFPTDYIDEIEKESIRQDRTRSWLVQKAWELSRDKIMAFPGVHDYLSESESENEKEPAE